MLPDHLQRGIVTQERVGTGVQGFGPVAEPDPTETGIFPIQDGLEFRIESDEKIVILKDLAVAEDEQGRDLVRFGLY